MIRYTIDNIDFNDFGVWVKESAGVVDLPKPKEIKSTSWAEYHGSVVDLRNVRMEQRQITLSCYLKADNSADFTAKILNFEKLLFGGLKRLQIDLTQDTSLFFDCYLSDEILVKKKWSEADMVGEFQIKLTEPEPQKKVLRFVATEAGKVFNITLSTLDAVQFSFGDGQTSGDVWGTDFEVEHEYSEAGEFFILIKGNIDNIHNITTNAEIIWEKL